MLNALHWLIMVLFKYVLCCSADHVTFNALNFLKHGIFFQLFCAAIGCNLLVLSPVE